jgi:hypothetical protein
MTFAHLPEMLISDTAGWTEVDRMHHSRRWFLTRLVLPLSALPPLLYAYAEVVHPGAVFPAAVPPQTTGQLLVTALVFWLTELAMVDLMATAIQRLALARDHDPGEDAAYALAAIAPVPLWLAALALLVPSRGFNGAVALLALLASIALIRHGVRPLLHIEDDKLARYITEVVTLVGVAAWIVLMVVSAMVLSLLLGYR